MYTRVMMKLLVTSLALVGTAGHLTPAASGGPEYKEGEGGVYKKVSNPFLRCAQGC